MPKYTSTFSDGGVYELRFYIDKAEVYERILCERLETDGIQVIGISKDKIFYESSVPTKWVEEHFKKVLQTLQVEFRKNNRQPIGDYDMR